MSDVAGAIGEGRLLVFQPATPAGTGLELALGVQRFWQKTLKAAGRPAACLIAHTRVEAIDGPVPDGLALAVGDRGVAMFKDWADQLANTQMVLSQTCRWGLVATFSHRPRRARTSTPPSSRRRPARRR